MAAAVAEGEAARSGGECVALRSRLSAKDAELRDVAGLWISHKGNLRVHGQGLTLVHCSDQL